MVTLKVRMIVAAKSFPHRVSKGISIEKQAFQSDCYYSGLDRNPQDN